jgi:diguanylate cyclase (GGDEF)-like protein
MYCGMSGIFSPLLKLIQPEIRLEKRAVTATGRSASRTCTRNRARKILFGGILVFAPALLFPGARAVAGPTPLNTLAAVTALDNAQARKALPVDFEATVVFSRGYQNILFVEDGKDAIFVRPPNQTPFAVGDRLRVHGKTQNSFRPIVVSDTLTLIAHGARPKPIQASFWDLLRADLDCHLISVRGRVRAANVNGANGQTPRDARLQLVTDGGHFEADVGSADIDALRRLLDADVEVTGASAGKFDDKMQQTGAVLYVASIQDIRVLRPAASQPSALPITPMDRILEGQRITDISLRTRVHGTITYYEPGVAVALQDGRKSLWIETRTQQPLTIGDQADASGFPAELDRILTLKDGEIEDRHIPGVATPFAAANWEQLAFWSENRPVGHENDLVSIAGRVVTQMREPSQDDYVLNAGGRLFSAIWRHPAIMPSGPMRQVPVGAMVRVTGICTIPNLSAINPGSYVPFQILLRTPGDVAMVARPPLLTMRNLVVLLGILLVVLILAIARAWALERKVRRQAGAMAQLEHRRSEILERINSGRPLAEVLEQVAALVSSRLKGAACWIEVAGGATLGNRPAQLSSEPSASREITGHGGATLGYVRAAVPAATASRGEEWGAMEMGAGLAALAIETHRLYADLTYRSEFDALTDVHNRFSLDKCLDEQVRQAREHATVFGLIYMDLDDFKQVNDLYGHHVGDLYLQEVSARMKRQMRPGDILARLGGDEFAILVPQVRNRAVVEEIKHRLQSCFAAAFMVEGHALKGSGSTGIAMYPEDGATSDALLHAADEAMYDEKNRKRTLVDEPAG